MPLGVPDVGAILGAPHPPREEVEAELAEKHAQRTKLEEARRERNRVREERRDRARERAGHEHLEREHEDEARRVRVIDIDLLKRRELKPNVDDAREPKTIVRRGLDDARVTKTEGQRVIALRMRDAEAAEKSKRRRRRRRESNDPPADDRPPEAAMRGPAPARAARRPLCGVIPRSRGESSMIKPGSTARPRKSRRGSGAGARAER